MKIITLANVPVCPTASAAGKRMLYLLESFINAGFETVFACSQEKNEYAFDLTKIGIRVEKIILNDDSFNDWIISENPAIVVFDRFICEEQFGWRVAKYTPDALRILDTEDLHCLRKVREKCLKNNDFSNGKLLESNHTKREIASIYRCDLSLIISPFEMEILDRVIGIPKNILYHLPLVLNDVAITNSKNTLSFKERTDFVSIGGFLHPPNQDMVQQLKIIWKNIRKKISDANLCIYGAYTPKNIMQLHNEKEGFLVKGWAKDVSKILRSAKILLAPIRFGAGVKGKIFDAMLHGLPSVTTKIGAEGIATEKTFAGKIASTAENFTDYAVELYKNKKAWENAQSKIAPILERYRASKHTSLFLAHLTKLKQTQKQHRSKNFIGAMLQHHSLQSHKYLSKWIMEKKKITNEFLCCCL